MQNASVILSKTAHKCESTNKPSASQEVSARKTGADKSALLVFPDPEDGVRQR
jgi:hypothetical protein